MNKDEWIKLHAYLRWHDREVKMDIKPQNEEERKRWEEFDWEIATMNYELDQKQVELSKQKLKINYAKPN